MVAHTKTEDRRPKSEIRRGAGRSSFLVLLSSLFVLLSSFFTLLLLAGCPGEDLTPPQVAIIQPAEGDSIAGTTTIRARATSDNKFVIIENTAIRETTSFGCHSPGSYPSFRNSAVFFRAGS